MRAILLFLIVFSFNGLAYQQDINNKALVQQARFYEQAASLLKQVSKNFEQLASLSEQKAILSEHYEYSARNLEQLANLYKHYDIFFKGLDREYEQYARLSKKDKVSYYPEFDIC